MKKMLALGLVLIFTLFASCRSGETANVPAKELFDKAVTLLSLPDKNVDIYYSGAAEEYMLFNDDTIPGKFGDITDYPLPDTFEDYAAYYSKNNYGTEFGIFKMKTKEQAENMKLYIDSRMDQKLKNAENYPGTDTTLIENYTVTVDGVWIYYAATNNNEGFNKLIKNRLHP